MYQLNCLLVYMYIQCINCINIMQHLHVPIFANFPRLSMSLLEINQISWFSYGSPKLLNRPFARSGHIVRKKLCWEANNAVGLSKLGWTGKSSFVLVICSFIFLMCVGMCVCERELFNYTVSV